MQRQEALKKLRRLLGDKLGYRVDPNAPTSNEREEARIALRDVRAEREMLGEKRQARRMAILAADADYQQLVKAHEEARKSADKLASLMHRYKFTVGTSSDMFFHVKAQGDNWEEIIAKLTGKKPSECA